MKPKHLALIAFKLLLSVFLMWLVLRHIDFSSVVERLHRVHLVYLAVGFGLTFTVIAVSARRWEKLARGLIPFGPALRYTWIGLFYGALLPGGISGDVVKGAALALKDRSTRVALLPGSILMDRIVGFAALLIFFTLGAAWYALSPGLESKLRSAAWIGVAGGATALIAAGALLSATVQVRLRKLAEFWPQRLGRNSLLQLGTTLSDYSREPQLLLYTFSLSLFAHALNVVLFLCFFSALDVSVGPFDAMFMYSGLSVLVMVPISISAIGVRDWFALLYFQHLHLPAEAGVAFSWLSLLFGLLVAAVGGLIQGYEFFLKSRSSVIVP